MKYLIEGNTMDLRIDPEFKGMIQKLSDDEYRQLEQNIINEGCRDALVVWNSIIIDGHTRYDICIKHDIEFNILEKEFTDREEAIDWIISNQLGRRNLTDEARTYLLGLQYKRRKLSHGGDRRSEKSRGNNFLLIDTAEEIAEDQKVSDRTVKNAEKFANAVDTIAENVGEAAKSAILSQEIKTFDKDIIEIAKLNPEDQRAAFDMVVEGEVKNLKQAKQAIIRKHTLNTVQGMPSGEYDVIYCDPPWKYEFSESDSRDIENQYPTMELDAIKALKIPYANNCVLLMWAPAPKLEESLEVMREWGFTYRTHAVWDKDIIGMGYWFRSQHELLLIGTKGSPKTPEPSVRISSVYNERRRGHSRKPNYYYDMIEIYFPGMRYLELFAREKYNDNWTVWGTL